MSFSVSLIAQSDELPPKKREKFDQAFFEAERYKLIDDFEKAEKFYRQCLEIDPNNSTVLYELSGLYFIKKDYEQAREYGEKAVELVEEKRWARARLIEIYSAMNMTDQIVVQYENLVLEYPKNSEYHWRLAEAYLKNSEFDKSIRELNELEKLEGITEPVSLQKKDLYLIQDDQESARKEIEALSNAYPINLEYMGMLAQFYMKYGPREQVEGIYLKMIEVAPNDPRAHLDLANYYRQENKPSLSIEHLRIALASDNMEIDPKISVLMSFYSIPKSDSAMTLLAFELIEITRLAHPTNPKVYSVRADFLMRDGDRMGAYRDLKKAMNLGATQLPIAEEIMLLDVELNQYDSLVVDAEMVIELYPNMPLGYLMSGMGYIQLKDYEMAIEYLESGIFYVVENEQLKEQFYIYLADAYHEIEDHINSDANYDKALAINPNNSLVLNNYAYYLALRKEKLKQALSMTELSNSIAPNNAGYLDTWAWVLFQSGEYNKALEKIDKALSINNTNAELLEHKGDILYFLNRKEEALEFWKMANKSSREDALLLKKIKDVKWYE